MGGLDFSGLPYAVALYGVTDLAGLLHRLQVIKHHNRPKRET